jgi:periplasmic divalent cation tolerance protein
MSEYRVLYVTAASEEEAAKLGRALVEEHLAACANVLGAIRSIYWWQGKLEEGAEAALILKTRADLVEKATERLKALHSYSLPCVIALPILGGNPDFLAWIGAETE